ncbi:peptidoglycan DD-metalloendopeptidase family protein [Massilia sp. METH4]|uniref:peptidoglycan DD-metalloendopeptidase family protein n=1 Tax=Massilia sp. METH4 TaxID=3123041 RepID=UPI0030CF7E91
MTKKSSLLVLLPLAVLTACTTTPNQAPVVERQITRRAPPPAPAPAPVQEVREGYYMVKKGDTLIRIALDHGQNYRDIVAWNNLANPNDIKVDQVLRVAPPEDAPGVRTAAVVMPPDLTKAPPAPKKTEPKGDKKPYTDAELKADKDADPKPATPPRVDKPVQLASVKPSVPAAAPAPTLSAEDREVSWMWPAEGKVVGQFDEGRNKGIDIAGRAGQQVLAAGAGKVMYAGSGIRGYGNLVIVKHSNGLLSAYAHNRSILVKEGQTVNKGQAIAEMGDSDSDSVKLHFEIRQQGKPVDPSKFLPNR